MSLITCEACGQSVDDGWPSCTECGHELEPDNDGVAWVSVEGMRAIAATGTSTAELEEAVARACELITEAAGSLPIVPLVKAEDAGFGPVPTSVTVTYVPYKAADS